MAKKLTQIIEKIPLERRNKIEVRAKELIAELGEQIPDEEIKKDKINTFNSTQETIDV